VTQMDWDRSAEAWLDERGKAGNWGRRLVLDRIMLDRVRRARPANALDVGCGEGRFCRKLAERGAAHVLGIDLCEEMIDAAGCRGMRVGAAQMSEKHCNFMINTGGASAAELEELGEAVRQKVYEHSGIMLRWEIRRIGVAAER